MTSIRESIRRLIRGEREPSIPDSRFAYRLHWTNQALAWSNEHRRRVWSALEAVMSRSDFEAGDTARVYCFRELDPSKHSGESLLELREVLEAFEGFSDMEGENHD